MAVAKKRQSPLNLSEKQQTKQVPIEKLFENARTLVDFLCSFYDVPFPDIIINQSWLRRHKALGSYFPDFHLMVLSKFRIETPVDCYVVVHEWQHHAFHGGHHR
jgi:hypothetical protein